MIPDGVPHVYLLLLLAAISGLAEALLIGFVPTAILLFVGRLLGATHRPLLHSLAAFANTLLLLGALLFLVAAVGSNVVGLLNGDEYEQYSLLNRLTGPYWFAYWGAVLSKGLLPQLLWLKQLRRSIGAGLALVPLLLLDYWLPLLYAAPHHDYLPSSWMMMRPDYWALALTGTGYLVVLVVGWLLTRVSVIIARRPRS